jgi:hypothetical protein
VSDLALFDDGYVPPPRKARKPKPAKPDNPHQKRDDEWVPNTPKDRAPEAWRRMMD